MPRFAVTAAEPAQAAAGQAMVSQQAPGEAALGQAATGPATILQEDTAQVPEVQGSLVSGGRLSPSAALPMAADMATVMASAGRQPWPGLGASDPQTKAQSSVAQHGVPSVPRFGSTEDSGHPEPVVVQMPESPSRVTSRGRSFTPDRDMLVPKSSGEGPPHFEGLLGTSPASEQAPLTTDPAPAEGPARASPALGLSSARPATASPEVSPEPTGMDSRLATHVTSGSFRLPRSSQTPGAGHMAVPNPFRVSPELLHALPAATTPLQALLTPAVRHRSPEKLQPASTQDLNVHASAAPVASPAVLLPACSQPASLLVSAAGSPSPDAELVASAKTSLLLQQHVLHQLQHSWQAAHRPNHCDLQQSEMHRQRFSCQPVHKAKLCWPQQSAAHHQKLRCCQLQSLSERHCQNQLPQMANSPLSPVPHVHSQQEVVQAAQQCCTREWSWQEDPINLQAATYLVITSCMGAAE